VLDLDYNRMCEADCFDATAYAFHKINIASMAVLHPVHLGCMRHQLTTSKISIRDFILQLIEELVFNAPTLTVSQSLPSEVQLH